LTETTTAGDAQVYEIPRDWLAVELGELCSIISGYGFPKSYQGKAEGQLPFFKVGDISRVVASGQHRLVQAQHYISQDESIELKATPLPKGTVVFAKIGEAIKLNRRAILAQDSLIDNNVMGLHAPSASLNQQYLYYWMLTVKFDEISRATAVPSIRKSDVEQLLMPFPPLNEQRRIVEKIEELFTKLDAGVRSLKQARGQLKSYRRSVLKAAVEGELSREWREAHRDELEPASELLDRILQERREKFTGKKYKEPASPDISELPALPDGWASATVDQLSREVRYGSSAKTNEESNGIPVLRMGNIKDGQLVTNALKYLPEAHGEFPELLLEPGDLLFNRTNSSELVGKTAIYTGTPEPSSFASYLIRVRFLSEVLPDFVSYFINSI
jgi:type I restriction enzyme S subunit